MKTTWTVNGVRRGRRGSHEMPALWVLRHPQPEGTGNGRGGAPRRLHHSSRWRAHAVVLGKRRRCTKDQ